MAREASADNIDSAFPRLAVKCLDIVPDWESRQDSVSLSGKQYAPRVVCPFDGANRSPSQQMASEDTSSSPCEQGEFSHSLSMCQAIHDPLSISCVVISFLVLCYVVKTDVRPVESDVERWRSGSAAVLRDFEAAVIVPSDPPKEVDRVRILLQVT